jgi:hypothetical protein
MLSLKRSLFFRDQAAVFASGAYACDTARDFLAPGKFFLLDYGCEKRTLAASFLKGADACNSTLSSQKAHPGCVRI